MAPFGLRIGNRERSRQDFIDSDDSSLSVHRRHTSESVLPFEFHRAGRGHVKNVMQNADQLGKPHVVRNLALSYIVCMIVVCVLAVTGQTIVQVWAQRSYTDSRVVNVAGRQRMLSQRIAGEALTLLAFSGSNRNFSNIHLRDALSNLSAAHYGLQTGNKTLGVPRTTKKSILYLFQELQPDFDAIYEAGNSVLKIVDNAGYSGTKLDASTLEPLVQTILDHEGGFFRTMNAIVTMYANQAKDHLHTLLIITWTTTAVLLFAILVEGLFVMRPALFRMQKLVGERFDLLRASLEAEASARSVSLLAVGYVAREVEDPLSSAMRSIKKAGKIMKDALRPSSGESCGGIIPEVASTETVEVALDLLREAQESCRLMSTVVDDISDMRRLENGQLTLRIASARPSAVLQGALHMVKDPNPGVNLSFEVQEGVDDIEFMTDVHRLQQVLIALISNAIKFTDQGFVKVHVSAPHSAWLRFEVLDSGKGLTEEACAKILMPFSKGQDKTGQKGTGLGLYIAKLLTDVLSGSLGVSSKVGEGSLFWVLLPTTPQASHPPPGIPSLDIPPFFPIRRSISSGSVSDSGGMGSRKGSFVKFVETEMVSKEGGEGDEVGNNLYDRKENGAVQGVVVKKEDQFSPKRGKNQGELEILIHKTRIPNHSSNMGNVGKGGVEEGETVPFRKPIVEESHRGGSLMSSLAGNNPLKKTTDSHRKTVAFSSTVFEPLLEGTEGEDLNRGVEHFKEEGVPVTKGEEVEEGSISRQGWHKPGKALGGVPESSPPGY